MKGSLETMKSRLTRTGIDLQIVMDQSIYVRRSIESLVEEGVLGAVLCSLVILLFLGQWRMTAIAVITIPISVLAAVACLYALGYTINVMTLAGLALAIGPLVDSAIICLENTHRHLGLGQKPNEAAFLGASEVALPELVSTLCTFLVLAPLAFMPGLGEFLYRPMALAVAFAMIVAYLLSRTFVPSRCAAWLRPHAGHDHDDELAPAPPLGRTASGLRLVGGPDRRRHRAVRWLTRLGAEAPLADGRRRGGVCWRRPSWCSVRGSAASSSPKSMPAPSRSSPGHRAAPGSRGPRRRSRGSRRLSVRSLAATSS